MSVSLSSQVVRSAFFGRSAASTGETPIRIGISSCLLGSRVRYDGGHKRDDFLVNTFGEWVEWVRVCPEVEVGMGTPREPIRLVQRGGETRLISFESGRDWTDEMAAYSVRRVRELEGAGLCGLVLKQGSPSCGLERVKLYGQGAPVKAGRGLFAETLCGLLPDLPVEEDGRLSEPRRRDNFVERVFAYRRVRRLFADEWSVGGLVAFQTAHALQLMAHSPQAYRELGRLVAAAEGARRTDVERTYTSGFMRGLKAPSTRPRNVSVLKHISGHLEKLLDEAGRVELLALIDDYRNGMVPLIVPITLIRHHVRAHEAARLTGQTYLEPHPTELMLRNHV